MSLLRHILVVCVGGMVVLGVAIEAHPDTLFRARQPVKIGHGTTEGAKIHWTDCSNQNSETFDKPPYSVDAADNCSVSPSTFGLQCEGESCKVVDATTLQKYIPSAREGQSVQLHIKQHSVELRSEAGSVHLER
jgi:hypothetical protein